MWVKAVGLLGPSVRCRSRNVDPRHNSGGSMDIAFCYESVLPARGGCETYIADLAGRLVADRHEVHLYACRWDAAALPENVHYHCLPAARGPRFLRPWRFGAACARALRGAQHDVSVG